MRDAKENVEATVKYDGSLGIAFAWNGEVMVTTKRRMDSEQAIWAKQWIKDHCDVTSFQAGYTYLFEIIYQNNTVIVNYLFEGLVLLAITDEGGAELPYEDVLNCARNMGFFMVTPRITAPYSEILWYCGGIDDTTKESTTSNRPTFISGALPENKRQEGWVVKFNDGSRQKIVYSWRNEVSKIVRLVHPQIVWFLVKQDKFKDRLCNLPSHFLVEVRRMIQAIGRKFTETVRHIEKYLTDLHVESQVSTQHRREQDGMSRGYISSSSLSDESTDSENDMNMVILCQQVEQLCLDKDEVTPANELYGKWSLYALSPFVSDESADSENDTGQETLSTQTGKLRLDDDKIKTSEMATSKNEVKHIKKSNMNKISDFVALACKFKPYWQVTSKKPKLRKSSYEAYETQKNISPIYKQNHSEECTRLRLPVLDYICPLSPILDGYQPSDNFKQTWCKGWKTLPINDIQFIQEVLHENHSTPQFLQLPVEVIVLLLEFLDGESVVMMTRVCVRLRHIVNSSKALTKQISLAKEEHDESLSSRSYHYPSYSTRYSWGGYGSY